MGQAKRSESKQSLTGDTLVCIGMVYEVLRGFRGHDVLPHELLHRGEL